MSRIGKNPISVPDNVKAEIKKSVIYISGPKGNLSFELKKDINVKIDSDHIMLTKLPIMLKSNYCILNNKKDEKYKKHECKFDQGGYFIINGGDKVIIPQEIINPQSVISFCHFS